ncbi:autophagy-related protein Atg10 [Histoplasma ohiense]|nr:autophagy-related protein Atg10 [Histoplasma ohiense (nom. inval.)]
MNPKLRKVVHEPINPAFPKCFSESYPMTALTSLSAFPYLTRDEFTAACRALISRVDTFLHHDEGDPTTSLGWTGVRLETKDDEVVLIIQKKLDDRKSTSPQHLKHPGDTFKNEVEEEDDDTADIVELNDDDDDDDDVDDDNDPEELIRQACTNLQVEYNIMLSPTYQVPILYFFLHDTKNDSSGMSAKSPDRHLDLIYNRIVPAPYRSELKSVGILGGLSIGHHPISDLPVYFVHPCNTPDALRDIAGSKPEVTAETYLLLWLGLVGNCVGLHVPSKILIERRNP